jgi:hypothetical protein
MQRANRGRVKVKVERHEPDRGGTPAHELGHGPFHQAKDELCSLEARQEPRLVERKLSLQKEVRTVPEVCRLWQATAAVKTIDVDAHAECLFRVDASLLESKKPPSPGDSELKRRDRRNTEHVRQACCVEDAVEVVRPQ